MVAETKPAATVAPNSFIGSPAILPDPKAMGRVAQIVVRLVSKMGARRRREAPANACATRNRERQRVAPRAGVNDRLKRCHY